MAIEDTISATGRPRLKGDPLALLVRRGVASIADQAAFGAVTFIVSLFIGRALGAEGLGTYATTNALFLLVYSTYDSVLLEPMSVFGPRRSSRARADGAVGEMVGIGRWRNLRLVQPAKAGVAAPAEITP
jgi:hypothetical protein